MIKIILIVSLIANFVFVREFLDLREDFENRVIKINGKYYLLKELQNGN